MTKERLRAYRELKAENAQIKELLEAAVNDELRLHYSSLLEKLEKEQLEIERAIDTLDMRERTLMRCYYIEGQTWEEVCDTMYYSWSQVHRVHAAALIKLKNMEAEV